MVNINIEKLQKIEVCNFFVSLVKVWTPQVFWLPSCEDLNFWF